LGLCPGRIKAVIACGHGGASLRKWVRTYSAVAGTDPSGEIPGETERMKSKAPKVFVLLCLIGLTVVLYLRTSRPWEQPGAGGGVPAQGAPMPEGQAPVLDAFFEEVAALERALEANPDDTVSLVRMGQLMVDSHQAERAIEYFQRYLALSPDDYVALFNLGAVYANLEQRDEALALWERVRGEASDSALVTMADEALAALR